MGTSLPIRWRRDAGGGPLVRPQRQGTPIAAKWRMLVVVFWIAVCCVLHTYLIYPLLLVALDAIAQARSAWGYLGGNERRRPLAQLGLPNVSVLIAAYNE